MEGLVTIILGSVIAAGVAFITLLFTLAGARRLGLTDLQKSVRLEESRLADTLRARVSLLETENVELQAKVIAQDSVIQIQSARIDALERKLTDMVMTPRPSASRAARR